MTGKNLPIRFTITWDWNPGLQDERRSYGGLQICVLFLKKGPIPASFYLFSLFSHDT